MRMPMTRYMAIAVIMVVMVMAMAMAGRKPAWVVLFHGAYIT
jgi:hypothetical protein